MYSNKTDWFELWEQDKKSMAATMHRNLMADLEAGYNPMGDSIRRQLGEIARYEAGYDADMRHLADKTPEQVQHWCYMDMKRRGAIE